MIKHKLIILLLCGLFISRIIPAQAVEIPDYIEQVEDVYKNICPIINALTSTATNSETAESDTKYAEELKRDLVSKLYAEAITMRAGFIKEEQDSLQNPQTPEAQKDKRGIMDNKIQPIMTSIARRINSIVSLEAGIAVLEATIAFTDIPKGDTDVLNRCKEDDEEEEE